MGDALCGPSNALQSFQKHTSVDRTLQQDRLISRQSPSQGFRSGLGPNAGALDAEFEAFQAGHVAGPPHHEFQHFQPHIPPGVPGPSVAAPSQLPAWAADFQNLQITSPPPLAQQHRQPPSAASSTWHQDFLSQQTPIAAPHTSHTPMQNTFSGFPMTGMGSYAHHSMQPMMRQSSVAQGKQREQELVPQFDDAAFERAFETAQAEALVEEHSPFEHVLEQEILGQDTAGQEAGELISILERSFLSQAGSETDGYPLSYLNASLRLERLERLAKSGRLAPGDRHIYSTLSRILQLPQIPADEQYHFRTRARDLIAKIESQSSLPEQLSTNHLVAQEEVEAALDMQATAPTGTLNETLDTLYHSDHPERLEQEQPQKEQHRPTSEEDDLAQTAGQLLESVAHETNEKFQNSQFLALMRKLRDYEVRVEGDKMVETTQSPNQANERIPLHEQDLDLGRSDISMSGAINNDRNDHDIASTY